MTLPEKSRPLQLAVGFRWALLGLLAATVLAGWLFFHHQEKQTVRIGILHALTGPMAVSEKPMVEAELLAIEEINATGGVLGMQVEAIVADTESNPETAAVSVEKLLVQDQVSTVIGCWTSACRKTVKPIIERNNSLLIYPMAYEGLETSPNIIYMGAAPNQQVLPAVNWAFENLGKRFFLIGSDYVWPHSVNAIVTDQLKALGGESVGEMYMPFGGLDASEAVRQIQAAKPDVILSTVVGDSNAPFYKALREAGISAEKTPVISFSIAETETKAIPHADLRGHYVAFGYFQTIDRLENHAFIDRFRARYGHDRLISDFVETAYFSTIFWHLGVERAESTEPTEVGQGILGLSYDAPEGIVTVDSSTRHAWRAFNMGKIDADGTIQIVWSAEHPIRPIPYPSSRSAPEWNAFLEGLYNTWGQQWVNRAPSANNPGARP